MTELENFLKGNTHLSKHTIRSYSRSYEKISDLLDVELQDAKQKDLLDIIDTLSESPNSRSQYMNAAIQIRRFYDKPVDKLLHARDKLGVKIQEVKDAVNDEKFDNLPNSNELTKWLNKLYAEERWRDYIINYLLITFNTRNKDLDLVIVDKKKDAKDKNTNYLVIRPSGTLAFIRRDYKTFGKYGEKENIFTAKRAAHAVREFVKEKEKQYPIYLLSTGTNKQIDESSLGKYIRARTLDGLSESDINKMQVSTIDKIGDFKQLKKMSKNRGTSVDTLISEYHLKFKNK